MKFKIILLMFLVIALGWPPCPSEAAGPDHGRVYELEKLRVVDGDTVKAFIEVGLDSWVYKKIRFNGINAPETHKLKTRKKGEAAKQYLIDLISKTSDIKMVGGKRTFGKFGRVLGTLIGLDAKGQPINLSTEMVNAGHAVFRKY